MNTFTYTIAIIIVMAAILSAQQVAAAHEVPQEISTLLTGLVFWLHQLLSEYETTSIKAGFHHHIPKAEKGAAVVAIPESLLENMSMSYSWADSLSLSTAEKNDIEFGHTVKMSKAFKTKASKGVRMLEKASKATKTHKINL